MRKSIISAVLIIFYCSISYAEGNIGSFMTRGDAVIEKTTPFAHYEVYAHNSLIGYVYDSLDIVPDIMGYSGPIEILVEIDKKGEIKNLKILSHNETMQYASGLTDDNFLGQFKGKGLKDEFTIGKDIDAITNATISSKSVATILRESLRKVASSLGISEINAPTYDKKTRSIIQDMKKAGLDPKKAKYQKRMKE